MNKLSKDNKITFNWESLEIVSEGKSALDARSFVGQFSQKHSVHSFLDGYGFDISDPIQKAELFGHFQESLQFIKRYFLKEGNSEDGLDLNMPQELYQITDITQLFDISTLGLEDKDQIHMSTWAGVVLKVMHTIVHVDKDLRQNYFKTIQMQIFDRIYKYIVRDQEDLLYLKSGDTDGENIPLADFQTKSKKSRDSIIIKLLHKKENVAEQLFDRIGVRFITQTKFDVLRVIKFLIENNIIMLHNIKPSRSHNTLIDIKSFKRKYKEYLEEPNASEEGVEKICQSCLIEDSIESENEHTRSDYRAIHFTARQLIKYQNPFMHEFSKLREEAKSMEFNPLAERILKLNTSSLFNTIRFFYPFEVQVTDIESHQKNTEGEASHTEYKKSQLISARDRLFKGLAKRK